MTAKYESPEGSFEIRHSINQPDCKYKYNLPIRCFQGSFEIPLGIWKYEIQNANLFCALLPQKPKI